MKLVVINEQVKRVLSAKNSSVQCFYHHNEINFDDSKCVGIICLNKRLIIYNKMIRKWFVPWKDCVLGIEEEEESSFQVLEKEVISNEHIFYLISLTFKKKEYMSSYVPNIENVWFLSSILRLNYTSFKCIRRT